MSFAWGACNAESRKLPLETLMQRYSGSGIVTRYYNPHVHIGAFALPQVPAARDCQAQQRLSEHGGIALNGPRQAAQAVLLLPARLNCCRFGGFY